MFLVGVELGFPLVGYLISPRFYLEPNDEQTTLVSVNSRYVFTVKRGEKVEFKNRLGHVVSSQPRVPSSSRITFSTLVRGSANIESSGQSATITCASTGALESKILAMAGR